MFKSKSVAMARECLGCPFPQCQKGCPCFNDIKEIIGLVKKGELEKAASILFKTNPFPELTSCLCDCRKQCQGSCLKNKTLSGPVQIKEIEHFLASKFTRDLTIKPANNKKVCVIGAGIAGLSASYYLAKEGYKVDIFEKDSYIGGAIKTGIPDFRFDKRYLLDIQKDLQLMGVSFHFNQTIGEGGIFVSSLKNDFDYVVAAIGATKENAPCFEPSDDIYGGISFLRLLNVHHLNENIKKNYKKALILGGGNVALDCARSAKRLMDDVTVIYRRGEEQMPASLDEISEAKKEGIKFLFQTNIKSVALSSSSLSGYTLIKTRLGKEDASGRASFEEIPDSEISYECSETMLITAIGEKPDLGPLGLSLDGVILCGDCKYGAKTVAHAIADGRLAAERIISDEQ